MEEIRTCKDCGEAKPLASFYKPGSPVKSCRACNYQRTKAWRADHPEHARRTAREYQQRRRQADPEGTRLLARQGTLKRYKMTIQDYEQRLEDQGGVCRFCGEKPAGVLDVDHDHRCCPGVTTCGQCTRGLLCRSCNSKTGWLERRREEIMTYLDSTQRGDSVTRLTATSTQS